MQRDVLSLNSNHHQNWRRAFFLAQKSVVNGIIWVIDGPTTSTRDGRIGDPFGQKNESTREFIDIVILKFFAQCAKGRNFFFFLSKIDLSSFYVVDLKSRCSLRSILRSLSNQAVIYIDNSRYSGLENKFVAFWWVKGMCARVEFVKSKLESNSNSIRV